MERYIEGKSKYIEKIIIIAIILVIMCILYSFKTISADNSSHVVMDIDSGRILSGDNLDRRLPMASTTKTMTALVAIESGKMQEKVTITHEMVGIEGSSIYLKEGEILTVEELLYGLMLRSGNDSAVAIAIGTYGSLDAFVNAMNDKAKMLKLDNTHFVNPHGLHDDDHYTTARDLATIARYAMCNDEFRIIVSSKSKIIGGVESEKRYLVNKNKLLSMYKYANGIKTGFTKKAGRCLVSGADNGKIRLVSVVLNEPNMWEYSINSMESAFSKYTPVDIAIDRAKIQDVSIDGKQYGICTHKTLKYPIMQNEMDKLSYDVEIDANKKNIKSGENVGKILVYLDKHLIFEEKIYTI